MADDIVTSTRHPTCTHRCACGAVFTHLPPSPDQCPLPARWSCDICEQDQRDAYFQQQEEAEKAKESPCPRS